MSYLVGKTFQLLIEILLRFVFDTRQLGNVVMAIAKEGARQRSRCFRDRNSFIVVYYDAFRKKEIYFRFSREYKRRI